MAQRQMDRNGLFSHTNHHLLSSCSKYLVRFGSLIGKVALCAFRVMMLSDFRKLLFSEPYHLSSNNYSFLIGSNGDNGCFLSIGFSGQGMRQ